MCSIVDLNSSKNDVCLSNCNHSLRLRTVNFEYDDWKAQRCMSLYWLVFINSDYIHHTLNRSTWITQTRWMHPYSCSSVQSIYIILCTLNPMSWGSIHSSLVPTSAFLHKKPCATNHSIFIYPCQAYSFEATNHKLNPAFMWNTF